MTEKEDSMKTKTVLLPLFSFAISSFGSFDRRHKRKELDVSLPGV